MADRGGRIVAVVRNPAKWASFGLPGTVMPAELGDAPALRAALAGATRVVSVVHASHTRAVLEAAPDARLVLLGSTRRFSRIPDAHGAAVLAGEQALLASGRPGVMLHPTMIYGGVDDGTVQRLAALLTRLPILPLPGGGTSLVQPIHRSDVVRAILAALDLNWTSPQALVIAGPTPLPYAKFVRAVARAAGLKFRLVVPLPVGPILALSRLAARLRGFPQAGADEIRRLAEDKNFDISAMVTVLGVQPISLTEGLARAFAETQN
jgi:uncharacterized protein YbjT (DUF2867 family)